MSRISGSNGPLPPPPGSPAQPPSATRATSPGWRDPRLWVGVLIVAVSVLVGARVLASADDTVAVWALAADAGSGDRLAADDLVSRRVRFADADELDHYYRVDDDLPADLTLLRGLGAGELLPRAAIGTAAESDVSEISIEVAPGLVPTDVDVGSVVDVYLVASRSGGDARQGAALTGVRVVDAPAAADGFGPEDQRQLVLAVGDDDVADFYDRLGSLTDPAISVVGHPR